jgi:hypothetical protein
VFLWDYLFIFALNCIYFIFLNYLIMKKQSFVVLFVAAAIFGSLSLLSSCTKLGQNLRFSLPMQTGSVNITIPPTSATGTVTFGPSSSVFNVDSFIKANTANQLGIANISSVKLTSCTITITNPTTENNFANFQSCAASFSSNTDSNPYTINIADNPDTYAATLSLPADTSVQLSGYLGNQFNYSVSGSLRRPITDTVKCTINYAFNIIVQG